MSSEWAVALVVVAAGFAYLAQERQLEDRRSINFDVRMTVVVLGSAALFAFAWYAARTAAGG